MKARVVLDGWDVQNVRHHPDPPCTDHPRHCGSPTSQLIASSTLQPRLCGMEGFLGLGVIGYAIEWFL